MDLLTNIITLTEKEICFLFLSSLSISVMAYGISCWHEIRTDIKSMTFDNIVNSTGDTEINTNVISESEPVSDAEEISFEYKELDFLSNIFSYKPWDAEMSYTDDFPMNLLGLPYQYADSKQENDFDELTIAYSA